MHLHKPIAICINVPSMLLALFAALFAGSVQCGVVTQNDASRATELVLQQPPAAVSPVDSFSRLNKLELQGAVARGLWTRACSLATNAMSRQEQDSGALKVFSLCRALQNDREAVGIALTRLHDIEPREHSYYSSLTSGILQIRSQSYAQATSALKSALQAQPGDPLALYFNGELQRLSGKSTQAVLSYKATLKHWPDHIPALVAAARLLASSQATKEKLQAALAMTERATLLDPSNQASWQLMVDLCDRTGQSGRASAIKLQWLNRPSLDLNLFLSTAKP